MSSKIEIDINESQRSCLINYVCDMKITDIVEAGKKLSSDQYRIYPTWDELEEMISALQYLAIKAEYQSTRQKLEKLADYLEEHQVDE